MIARPSRATQERAARWEDVIKRLARLSELLLTETPPAGAVQLLVRGELVALPLAGVIDVMVERQRLEKELSRLEAEVARMEAKLANAEFLQRAPEEVVEGEREKHDEAQRRRGQLVTALEQLNNAAMRPRATAKS
jgi:valyl-tRNA synthetase